jgi:purine catabolism regulator
VALRVRDVVALPDLGLLRLTGAAGWDAAVRWVAVSELVDPTPFLEGGEIVLTTGIPLREDADAAADYVGRLVSAGVAGLGVGLGLTWDAVPAAVVAAADAAGLPVFSVPEGTPFIAVTKAVSGPSRRRSTRRRPRVRRPARLSARPWLPTTTVWGR